MYCKLIINHLLTYYIYNMAKNNKATVLFVDKHQNNVVKPFQIPVTFLKNWKTFLVGAVATFVCMFSLIIYLVWDKSTNVSSNIAVQQQQVTPIIPVQTAPKIDESKLKSKFEAIDEKLAKINRFFKSKGLKPIFKNVSNDVKEGLSWASLSQTVDNYNSKLEETVSKMASVPLGKPVDGNITSFFGGRSNPFSGHGAETHKGLDLSGSKGDIVKSTAAGDVIFAGNQHGYGNVVIVKHAHGYETKYAHLSKILVRSGASIDTGAEIGRVGSTGRSTGPHLHYEVLKNGRQINPKAFLNVE